MRRFAILLLSSVLIAPYGAAGQQAPTPARAPVSLPPGVTAGPTVEGVSEYRLANGLRVLLYPDASTPTMLVNVTYSVGAVDENYGESGMAHLLEHLLFKGTPKIPNMASDFQARGITFNGTTGQDRTNYYGWFPANEQTLEWLLTAEADRMINARVTKAALDSEMTVVRNELEINESRPSSLLTNRSASQAYLWHAYGKDALGNRADVENVPIDRLQAFYRRWYQPDTATVIVAGGVDPAKVLRIVQKTFGRIKRPDRVLPTKYTVEPAQDGEREVTIRRAGASPLLALTYHVPAITHPDLPALRVLDSIMGHSPSGRLEKSLVTTRLSTESVSDVSDFVAPALMSFYANVTAGTDPARVEKILIDEVEHTASRPFTDDEVARAKQRLANMYNHDTNVIGVANGLSEAIASGDWRLAFIMRDWVARVTTADVNRVAQTYLVPSNRTLARFIPTKNPQSVAIGRAPDAAKLLEGYTGRQAVAAGEVFDPSYANITARTEFTTVGSGLKVALLPKKSRGNEVDAIMTFRFGDDVTTSRYKDAAGVLGSLLMKGTATMTREQIAQRLVDLDASVSILGFPNSIYVVIRSKRENFIPAMRLVADIVQHPSVPEAELEQLRSQMINGLARQGSEPGQLVDFAMRKHFDRWPEGDPRALKTPDQQIARLKMLTRDQLLTFHRDFYGTSEGQVAIVGDFDPAAVKTALNDNFAGWKSKSPYVETKKPYFEPATVVRKSFETPDKANGVITSQAHFDMSPDDPDHAALMVASRVFGSGAMSSRLGDRIRVKGGLSYYVGGGVIIDPEEPTQTFYMQATAAPENMGKVEAAMREELRRFVDTGITQKELDEAKSSLLSIYEDGRSTDGTIAAKLRLNLQLGRTLQWDEDFERSIRNLTLAQANAAIKRRIRPEAVSTFLAGDFAEAARRRPGSVQ